MKTSKKVKLHEVSASSKSTSISTYSPPTSSSFSTPVSSNKASKIHDGRRKISFSAESLLIAAIQDGDMEDLARVLHSQAHNININQTNHIGLTPLHHSVLGNNLDAVKILLCSGAEVNAQDENGFSPLHTASACGFIQTVSLLLLFGADVFQLTKEAELPIDVCKDTNVIRLLSQEMYTKIHKELYFSAWIGRKVHESWHLFVNLLVDAWRYMRKSYLQYLSDYRTKKD